MKKTDIITLSFIAIIGVIVSFFIVRAIVGDPDEKQEKVKTIEVVQRDVAQPSSNTFNSQALNPTVEVYVGDPNSQNNQNSQDNNP